MKTKIVSAILGEAKLPGRPIQGPLSMELEADSAGESLENGGFEQLGLTWMFDPRAEGSDTYGYLVAKPEHEEILTKHVDKLRRIANREVVQLNDLEDPPELMSLNWDWKSPDEMVDAMRQLRKWGIKTKIARDGHELVVTPSGS